MSLIDHINKQRLVLPSLRNVHKIRLYLGLFCAIMFYCVIYSYNSESTSLRLGRGSRSHSIGKVSILYGSKKPAHERALKTHYEHNRIHGYKMHLLRHDLLDGYWTKPAYILSILLQQLEKADSKRLKWLFWVDADTVVLNNNIPLEIFLPPPEHKDIHLLVTDDWNGLNNGVFFVAVNAWAVELFTSITSFRDFKPNTTLTFQDQSAMENVLKEPKYANHTVRVPQRWFNAYRDVKDEELKEEQVRAGDFLVHLAGVNPREQFLDEWCDRFEEDPAKWQVALENTTYPGEIEKFWKDIKI